MTREGEPGRHRRRRRFKRLRNRLLLGPIDAAIFLVSLLSPESASRLGAAAGRLAFSFLPGPARRARAHLEIAFGDRLSPSARVRIALRSFCLLGASAVEWLSLVRRGPAFAAGRLVEVEGIEHADRALAAGRGVIIVTGHFGLFELMPVWFAVRGDAGKVVGRRNSDRGFEALVTGFRRRMRVETVPQSRPRDMLRVLRAGQILGILPDQDIDKLQGEFIPFFGREAYTPTGPAGLSVRTGAPILPAFMVHLRPGRHRLEVGPPLPDPGGPAEERVRALAVAYTRAIEDAIRKRPDHWAWIHRRWATTPAKLARRRARRAREQAARVRAEMKNK